MATVNGIHYADFAVGYGIYGTPYLKFSHTYGLCVQPDENDCKSASCTIGLDRGKAIHTAYEAAEVGNRVEIWKDGVLVDVYTAGQLL